MAAAVSAQSRTNVVGRFSEILLHTFVVLHCLLYLLVASSLIDSSSLCCDPERCMLEEIDLIFQLQLQGPTQNWWLTCCCFRSVASFVPHFAFAAVRNLRFSCVVLILVSSEP